MTTPLIRALTVAVAVSLAACGRSAPEETESESVVPVTTAMAPPVIGIRVTRMEVAATFGGASEVTYVTESGRRVKKGGE